MANEFVTLSLSSIGINPINCLVIFFETNDNAFNHSTHSSSLSQVYMYVFPRYVPSKQLLISNDFEQFSQEENDPGIILTGKLSF